jgi:integrase
LEERGSPSLVGRGIANPEQVQQQSPLDNTRFTLYLKTQNKRNIRQILCYARRYATVLETGDATPLVNLHSDTMRHHTLEALANLAKYQGRYDRWLQIRQRYNLKWSNGSNSLQSLQRFFNPSLSFDVMLQRVRNMIEHLPKSMIPIIKFACLTGLRPAEACESVRLINGLENYKTYYYNPEQQCLEHFRFADIFLRQTKKAYLSYITKEMLSGIGVFGCRTPTYTAIRKACRYRNINMDMRLCRKIFASHLIQSGIDATTVDMLSGRCPPSVLARHYQVPTATLRQRVLDAVEKLEKQI